MHTERPSLSICLTLLPSIPAFLSFSQACFTFNKLWPASVKQPMRLTSNNGCHWLVDWHVPTPLCCFMWIQTVRNDLSLYIPHSLHPFCESMEPTATGQHNRPDVVWDLSAMDITLSTLPSLGLISWWSFFWVFDGMVLEWLFTGFDIMKSIARTLGVEGISCAATPCHTVLPTCKKEGFSHGWNNGTCHESSWSMQSSLGLSENKMTPNPTVYDIDDVFS